MDVWHLVWLLLPRLMLRYFGAFSLWLIFFWGLEIGENVMIITVQMRFAENLWFSSSLSSNFSQEETRVGTTVHCDYLNVSICIAAF